MTAETDARPIAPSAAGRLDVRFRLMFTDFIDAETEADHPDLPPVGWDIEHQATRSDRAVAITGELSPEWIENTSGGSDDPGVREEVIISGMQRWADALDLTAPEYGGSAGHSHMLRHDIDNRDVLWSTGSIGLYRIAIWGAL